MSNRLLIFVFFIPIIIATYFYISFLSPVDPKADTQIFVVDAKSTKIQVIDKLYGQDLIKNTSIFNMFSSFVSNKDIEPGGYYLSKSQNILQIAKKITNSPDLIWLTFSPGLRKEQIGQILSDNLNWSNEELVKWNTVYTTTSDDYIEGVYFPDTYLIPVDETGDKIAKKMISNFNDKLAPLLPEFSKQNIKWTTAIKIASLLERESGGLDMPLIAGIIWNRLNQDMKLDIDATVQYAQGLTVSGWWSSITGDQTRSIDSPYNTYKNKGLPPTPICNPGLGAIKAVLYPQKTDCIFYLHDNSGQIHCSQTYQEHLDYIEKYL